jgi:hypothetical protein
VAVVPVARAPPVVEEVGAARFLGLGEPEMGWVVEEEDLEKGRVVVGGPVECDATAKAVPAAAEAA